MSRCLLVCVVLLVHGGLTRGAVAEESPTPAERAAVAALAAKGCNVQINGGFQVIGIGAAPSSRDLAAPRLTDADLALMKQLPQLEMVIIRSDDITDAGLEHLAGLRRLKSVSLYAGKITPDGLKKLQAALPGCTISSRTNPVPGGFGAAANRANPQPAGIPPEILDRLRQQQAERDGGFSGSTSTRVSSSSLLGLAAQFDIQAELELTRAQGTQIAKVFRELGNPRERSREIMERARQAATPEERAKLTTELQTFVERDQQRESDRIREIVERARQAPSAEDRAKITAELRTFMEQNQQNEIDRVREVLRPAQLTRLQQIFWQRRGTSALQDARFAEALKLTDDQRTQIDELLRNRMTSAMRRDRTDPNVNPITIAAELDVKILAVLTDEQRARYDELLGTPLDVTDEQRARQAFVYLDHDENGELSADEFRASHGGTRRLFQQTEFPLIFPATREEFTTAYVKAREAARNPTAPLGGDRAPTIRRTPDTFEEPPPAN